MSEFRDYLEESDQFKAVITKDKHIKTDLLKLYKIEAEDKGENRAILKGEKKNLMAYIKDIGLVSAQIFTFEKDK